MASIDEILDAIDADPAKAKGSALAPLADLARARRVYAKLNPTDDGEPQEKCPNKAAVAASG